MVHLPQKTDLPNGNSATPPLVERIIAFRPTVQPEPPPTIDDRWLLASNLQKTIRRGALASALGTCVKLLAVNPQYFWRRLMVIAYEDVGYGNITGCHDLLKTFRREALQRDLGPERVAQYFVQELAQSTKSRSLCDALAMLEFSVRRIEREREAGEMSEDQLIGTVVNIELPILNRIAALRHICGYGTFEGGRHKTVSRAKPELMRLVCARQDLTETETTLFFSGQNVAESLNIPIPIISKMARVNGRSEQASIHVLDGESEVLYAAIDRHTRIGNRCFGRLAKEASALREFFTRRPTIDPVPVLGVVAFIVEGAVLDRWLVFDGSDQLREEFNRTFLEHAGVTGGGADELADLFRDHQGQLNRIRAQEIRR